MNDLRKHLDALYQRFNADYPAGAFRDAMDLLRESEARESQRRAACEPGTAPAIIESMFDLAEQKCGHNPIAARHALTTIEEWIDRAKERERELVEENDYFGKLNAIWIAEEERWKDERRELVEALSKIVNWRRSSICANQDHKPLRHPLCAKCQLDARIEEASAIVARATGAQP